MCGIVGYARMAGQGRIDPSHLERMVSTVSHRGPDDRGSFFTARVAMANVRLAVIDLVGGKQPISNEDGTITVVFNGEIYNHHELRAELQGRNHRFRTLSDTEVLVHLYEEHGDDFVALLDGMFAFALHDSRRDRLLIARDRFGVKPLFYSEVGEEIRFASEIKALRIFPDFDPAPSPEGLATALGLMFVADPWTGYREVRRLRAGHYLRVDRDGIAEIEFSDWNLADKRNISRDEAAEEAATLLRAALKRQMISDVPVGVLLSGGLDSRTMAYLAAQERNGVQAFTIGFDEGAFDETASAARWAAAIGVPHHQMRFTETDFCARYLARQAHLDEPYSLWCNVASARMAEVVRESGFKVVIGGDGGDELFLGYPTINAALVARWYRKLPQWLRQGLIKPLVQRLPAGHSKLPFSFVAKSFVESDDPDIFRTFFGFKEVLRYSDWPRLLTPEALSLVSAHDPFIAHRQYLPKVEGLSLVDALSYMDFRVFLPGASLYGADNAYMASSVELRVPFLDNALADFAAGLPCAVRFDFARLKPVLVKALRDRILGRAYGKARSALKGYRKSGFEVPASAWLRRDGCFATLLSEVLSPSRVARVGFFQAKAVSRLLAEQTGGRSNHERALQVVASVNLFLEGRRGGEGA